MARTSLHSERIVTNIGREYSTLLLWQGPERITGDEQGVLKSPPSPRIRNGTPDPEGNGSRTAYGEDPSHRHYKPRPHGPGWNPLRYHFRGAGALRSKARSDNPQRGELGTGSCGSPSQGPTFSEVYASQSRISGGHLEINPSTPMTLLVRNL